MFQLNVVQKYSYWANKYIIQVYTSSKHKELQLHHGHRLHREHNGRKPRVLNFQPQSKNMFERFRNGLRAHGKWDLTAWTVSSGHRFAGFLYNLYDYTACSSKHVTQLWGNDNIYIGDYCTTLYANTVTVHIKTEVGCIGSLLHFNYSLTSIYVSHRKMVTTITLTVYTFTFKDPKHTNSSRWSILTSRRGTYTVFTNGFIDTTDKTDHQSEMGFNLWAGALNADNLLFKSTQWCILKDFWGARFKNLSLRSAENVDTMLPHSGWMKWYTVQSLISHLPDAVCMCSMILKTYTCSRTGNCV